MLEFQNYYVCHTWYLNLPVFVHISFAVQHCSADHNKIEPIIFLWLGVAFYTFEILFIAAWPEDAFYTSVTLLLLEFSSLAITVLMYQNGNRLWGGSVTVGSTMHLLYCPTSENEKKHSNTLVKTVGTRHMMMNTSITKNFRCHFLSLRICS
jgi:hypothetical protein